MQVEELSMNTTFRAAMSALALAGGLVATQVQAQSQPPANAYPISRCNGENCEIDYGPMGQATLVGGGRVMISPVDGMTQQVIHLDAMFSQTPRPGFVPLSIGMGENSSVIYVPAMMMEQVRRAMASMPRR
jgi:hypothetical protein